MGLTVRHAFQSSVPDDADSSLMRPSDWNADHTVTPATPEEQTGASYTFDINDADKTTVFNSASAQTATIPPNSDVAFPLGTKLWGFRRGAGLVTFAAGSGVTLLLPTGIKPNRPMECLLTKSSGQNVTSGADAIVTWDNNVKNTDNFRSGTSSQIVIPAGVVGAVFSAGIGLTDEGTAAAHVWFGHILKGGSFVYDGRAAASDATGAVDTTKSLNLRTTSLTVAAGDVFEVDAFQTSGETLQVRANADTWFGCEVTAIDPLGTITYRYGRVGWEKIDTNVWAPFDMSGLG